MQGIVGALRAFDVFYRRNRRQFEGNTVLSRNARDFRRIVGNTALTDENSIWRILRKLKDDAVLEVYRDCRLLTEKYNLRLRSPLAAGEVALRSSSIMEDAPRDITTRLTGVFGPEISEQLDNYFFIENTRKSGLTGGWLHNAPQGKAGYADEFDYIANRQIFTIHATRFVLRNPAGNAMLRLWKGNYLGSPGGEIGFYGAPRSVTNDKMKDKVAAVTAEFLRLINPNIEAGNIRREAEDLLGQTGGFRGVPPLELKRRLIDRLLSSDQEIIRVNTDLISRGYSFFMRDMQAWLMSSDALLPRQLLAMLSPHVLAVIISRKQMVNFIVNIEELRQGMLDNSEVFSNSWGHSLSPEELVSKLGLAGTTVQVFAKHNGNLIAERREHSPVFWTTAFALNNVLPVHLQTLRQGQLLRDAIYTANHFHFKDAESAGRFQDNVAEELPEAKDYQENHGEMISEPARPNATTVIIKYGREA